MTDYEAEMPCLPHRVRARLLDFLLAGTMEPELADQLRDAGVQLRPGCAVAHVDADPQGGLAVTLADGERLQVDQVIAATGYAYDVARLDFLAPGIKAAMRTHRGLPVLDRYAQSSLGGLYFVGYPCVGRFGPQAQFVSGSRQVVPCVLRGLHADAC